VLEVEPTPLVSVAVWPPEVAEMVTRPSPATLQIHSLGDAACQTGAGRQRIDWGR